MPDFHVGDRVQIVSPKARVERMASFVITEFKSFGPSDDHKDEELCATGDGHAWWPVEMLDYAPEYKLTPDQSTAAEMLEFEMHEFIVAMRRIARAQQEAAKVLPGWYIKRIRDAATGP